MIAYRLSHTRYADRLSSSGAANRWNKAFQFVIYCSENISLCALELLAHSNGLRPAGEFKIMKIEISSQAKIMSIDPSDLPENWHLLKAYAHSQQIGSAWYESKSTLCMKVPSAIIPSEFNVIINTRHQEFDESVKLVDRQNFFWDRRFPSR